MVAPPQARARTFSLVFAALLLLSVIPFVPSAAAAISHTGTPTTVLKIGSNTVPANHVFKGGMSFSIETTATFDVPGGDCNNHPTFTASANLALIGPTYTSTQALTTVIVSPATRDVTTTQSYTVRATGTFNVGEFTAASGGGLNGATHTINAIITASCDLPQATSANTGAVPSQAISLDNRIPAGTVAIQGQSGTGGIGSTFNLGFAGLTDVATYEIHLQQVDNTKGNNGLISGSGAPATETAVTVRDLGFETPILKVQLADAAGNALNITPPSVSGFVLDNKRPDANTIDSLVQTAPAGTSADDLAKMVLTLSQPTETPTVTFDVTVTTVSAATQTSFNLVCPGTHCVEQTAPAGKRKFSIESPSTQHFTSYRLSVLTKDPRGNAATTTTQSTPVHLQMLPKASLAVTGDNGPGKTLTLTPTILQAANVTRIIANVAPVKTDAPTTVVWDAPDFAAKTVVTQTTGNDPAVITAEAYGSGPGGSTNAVVRTAPVTQPALDLKAPLPPTGNAILTSGGNIQFSITPGNGDDVADIASFEATFSPAPTTGPNPKTWTKTGSAPFNSPVYNAADGIQKDVPYTIDIKAVDDVGNKGPHLRLTATPSDNPLSLTLNALPAFAKVFPAISGTWASSGGMSDIKVNITKGTAFPPTHYWNGAALTATPFSFTATKTGATWSLASTGAPLPSDSGTYTVRVTIGQPPNELVRTSTLIVDTSEPTAPVLVIANPTSPGHMQGHSLPISFSGGGDQGDSGLAKVIFLLRNNTDATHPNVFNIAGTSPIEVQVALSGETSIPSTTVFTPTFGNFRLGHHNLDVHAVFEDRAGNRGPESAAIPVKFLPRIAFAKDGSPSADANGVRARIYAGWDHVNSFDPSTLCDQDTCRVTEIKIFGRNRTATTSSGSEMGSPIRSPFSGPDKSRDAAGPMYYNYTPQTPIPLGSLNTVALNGFLEIEARATVKLANNNELTARSGWVRVGTDAAPGGLAIVRPVDTTFVYPSGAIGDVDFEVTYDPAGAVALPFVSLSLRKLTTPASHTYTPVDWNNTGGSAPFWVRPERSGSGSLFRFSWDNRVPLTAGEYILEARAHASEGDPNNFLAKSERYFAISGQSPRLVFDVASDVHRGQFVNQTFEYGFTIDHGHANVSLSNVRLQLESPGTTPLLPGDGGFQAVNLFFTPDPPTVLPRDALKTQAKYRITLPSANESRYDLRITVEHPGAQATPALNASQRVSLLRPIHVDGTPPTAVINVNESALTGAALTSRLRIIGASFENGAGIANVRVKIYDPTWNVTYDPDAQSTGRFVPGDLDKWLTSDPTYKSQQTFVTDLRVVRDGPSSPNHFWELDSQRTFTEPDGAGGTQSRPFSTIPVNRSSAYRVTVVVTDNVSRSNAVTQEIRFDTLPPEVRTAISGPAIGTTVDSKPTAPIVLSTTVRDNHCVQDVRLHGVTEAGGLLGPASFKRPSDPNAQCTATTGNTEATWTIDLRDHPSMTSATGNVTYHVEAIDSIGLNATGLRTYRLRIVDNSPPNVYEVRASPAVVPVGTSTRILAKLFENNGIAEVKATINRTTASGGAVTLLTTTLPADADTLLANGSGTYAVDTSALAIDLVEGNYTVDVQAIDLGPLDRTCPGGCPVVRGTFRVASDLAPVVTIDQPTGTVVNATPTIKGRVIDRAINRSGVVVEASVNGGTFATVNPTFTNVTSLTGNFTGLEFTFAPTLPTNTTSYDFRITATSPTGTNATSKNWTVDGTPPTVAHTLTGNRTIGGRPYAVPETAINLSASDNGSGLEAIRVRVNAGSFAPWNNQPIRPHALAAENDTEVRVTYTATDKVGNVATGSVVLNVDKKGPVIAIASISSAGDEIVMTVTDAGAGLDEGNVTVFYAYGNATSFAQEKATKVTPNGNSYRVRLLGNATETGMRFYVEAKDVLGNVERKHTPSAPYIIPKDTTGDLPTNQAPVVTISRPTTGEQLRGSIPIRWTAVDPDDDAMSIRIDLREPVGPGRNLVPTMENTGSFTLNATGLAAGAYTIVVTANDGNLTGQATVTISIERGETIQLRSPVPHEVRILSAVLLTVDVLSSRTVSLATYTIIRDGQIHSSGPLLAEQGVYAGKFTPDAPGNYVVEVVVTYADGTTEKASVTSFSVPAPEVDETVVPTGFVSVLVLAAATVGLAAYGAFGRWRK